MLRALKRHFDPNDIMNPGGTLGLEPTRAPWSRLGRKELEGRTRGGNDRRADPGDRRRHAVDARRAGGLARRSARPRQDAHRAVLLRAPRLGRAAAENYWEVLAKPAGSCSPCRPTCRPHRRRDPHHPARHLRQRRPRRQAPAPRHRVAGPPQGEHEGSSRRSRCPPQSRRACTRFVEYAVSLLPLELDPAEPARNLGEDPQVPLPLRVPHPSPHRRVPRLVRQHHRHDPLRREKIALGRQPGPEVAALPRRAREAARAGPARRAAGPDHRRRGRSRPASRRACR